MSKDLWLPKGFELNDGSNITSHLFLGDKWQIYETTRKSNILVVLPELTKQWCDLGLVHDSMFGELCFGAGYYRCLFSPKRYLLTPVEECPSPECKVDAIAFAIALRESRKLTEESSFHDAIYLEQYSRLLPTWSLTPCLEDRIVLGKWITGGVNISTDSFRRLKNLAGWMSLDDLVEIIDAAGFPVPADAHLLVKNNARNKNCSGDLQVIAAEIDHTSGVNLASTIGNCRQFRLPGRSDLELFFNDHVIDIIFNPERYQAMGIDFPSAIILHGPPGCGKTFAVERLVEFIDWPSYSIDSNSVGSPYIHETSKKISGIFDTAIEAAPSVVVIDEMESFLSDRRSGGSSGIYHVEEVAEFLRRIPEAINSKVLIIAMTNMIDLIDPAILRRGRFDHVIKVEMPSKSEVSALLDSLLSKLPKIDNLYLESVIETLTGKALSDCTFLVREAARLAAKSGKSKIDQECIDSALGRIFENHEGKSSRIGFI